MTICEYCEDSDTKMIRMQKYKEAIEKLLNLSERDKKTEKQNDSFKHAE